MPARFRHEEELETGESRLQAATVKGNAATGRIQRRDSVAASVVDNVPYDILIDRNPYPGDVAKFRKHLAQQILSGKLTHTEIVAMGTINGFDGVTGCGMDGLRR